MCKNKKNDVQTIVEHTGERFTGLSVVLRDFPSIETVQNKRSISFRPAPRASDFKVTHHRSYSRCFLSVYLHGTPRRSLSNEILPEPVKPTKTQAILSPTLMFTPSTASLGKEGDLFQKIRRTLKAKLVKTMFIYLKASLA